MSHAEQPVHVVGEKDNPKAAMLMVHGRGATAESILMLRQEFFHPEIVWVAPQAARNTWYPYSFMAPMQQNEPHLSSALEKVGAVMAQIEEMGVPPEKTLLLGFSQGACLATEYAARNAQRYGGVIGLSGGLIGPEGTERAYEGSLAGTPIFLGCSDPDPHIPASRVRETAEVFEGLGAQVDMRLYPNMGHTVNTDEVQAVQAIIKDVLT